MVSKQTQRTIQVRLCDSSQESCFHTIEKRHQFDSYLPGAKLKCAVEKKSKNGYQVTISDKLFAYIHSNHLPIAKREVFFGSKKKSTTSDNPNELKNGEKVVGTIIFVNPYSKVVYLSMLPHLTDSTKAAKTTKLFLDSEEGLKLGQVVKDAQVTELDRFLILVSGSLELVELRIFFYEKLIPPY